MHRWTREITGVVLATSLFGCGRTYWDDLDDRLDDQGPVRVGVIGAFNEPGNIYCPVVTPYLRGEVNALDGHEIVVPDSNALSTIVGDIRRQATDLFDDRQVARYGRMLDLDVAIIGIIDQHSDDRMWVRAVDTRSGLLYLAGQIRVDMTVETELANDVPALKPQYASSRQLVAGDFARFFVGELQLGAGDMETIALDIKEVAPISSTVVRVRYSLNSRASRQDGEGTISLTERRVRLAGLGYGSVGIDERGKLVMESMDRIAWWKLTEE